MILKELKMERKSLILWVLFQQFFVIASMQKYTAFTGAGAEEMIAIFEKMPYFLKAMFGMAALDITTIVGYYGALYFYLILIVSIHALLLGIKIVTREEANHISEFLYTKPISRNKILLNKLFASLIIILIINLSIYVPSLFIIKGFSGDYLFIEIAISLIASLVTSFFFLSIGIFLSSIFNSKKASYFGLLYLSVSFTISIVIDIFEKSNFLYFLTPFKYFDAKDFLVNKQLNLVNLFLVLLVSFIILFYSFYKFRKKDIEI